MWKFIDLQEIAEDDRFKPTPTYTWDKARWAANQHSNVYRVDGNRFYVDMERTSLTLEQIKMRLYWGCQWNDCRIYYKG